MTKRTDSAETGELPPERVTVFSDQWHDWDRKGRNCEGSVFGAVFVGAGVILLLNTTGAVSWDVWQHVWRFWPLLLVFIGLKAMLGGSRFTSWIGNVISLALVVLVGLFAVQQVSPQLLTNLPPEIARILAAMKGLQP